MKQLETHPAFREARTVVIYFSLKDEVHTHFFIEKWAKSKTILLPAIIGDELELRVYSGADDLTTGPYNIPEPVGKPFTELAGIDLIVIPGMAFDRLGNRLGRGKGYYDKLLPQLDAFKIGLCFPFQLVEEVPVEAFDICMDAVLSGKQTTGK